jgi:hypothetical protein
MHVSLLELNRANTTFFGLGQGLDSALIAFSSVHMTNTDVFRFGILIRESVFTIPSFDRTQA